MTGTAIRMPPVAGVAPRRRKLVLGNWKMNGSRDAIRAWCEALRRELAGVAPEAGPDLGLLPPFPYLGEAVRGLEGTGWRVGAQDLSPHDAGAFTGDVSGAMLAELGCAWVLVGHSERRAEHGESDALVSPPSSPRRRAPA